MGLISGTSRDGLDLALARFPGTGMEVVESKCLPYPSGLRARVDKLIMAGRRPTNEELVEPDHQMGDFIGEAILEWLNELSLSKREICAIGSHGQTVWHEPQGPSPVSLQLGDGQVIAERTGITTVTDFRTADVEAGGEGAPLAPLLHERMFRHEFERRAVLNLGGIANLTLLAPGEPVEGFDSGPANCLMDAWINLHQGEAFDRDGTWAETGNLLPGLLARLMDETYFDLPPPKSTGLELFNPDWLASRLGDGDPDPADVQRTLLELTVQSIHKAVTTWQPNRILVCGGGVHNTFLMHRLQELLAPAVVESTTPYGADPDCVEALLFAWLARERLARHTHDTRPITGADNPVMLGEVHSTGPL